MGYTKNRIETVLKNWLDKLGRTDPIGYYLNYSDHTLEIYTTIPGKLIGRAGVNVDDLKQMMVDEYHSNWNVRFIEIRGGFLNV